MEFFGSVSAFTTPGVIGDDVFGVVNVSGPTFDYFHMHAIDGIDFAIFRGIPGNVFGRPDTVNPPDNHGISGLDLS